MHFLRALLFCVQLSLGYTLFLIAMTCNVYLSITMLIGSCLGFCVFYHRLEKCSFIKKEPPQLPENNQIFTLDWFY